MSERSRKWVATCSTGFEDLVVADIVRAGGEVEEKKNNAISFYADIKTVYELNMSSRVCVHILQSIDSFFAGDTDELYRKIRRINWGSYFSVSKTFRVDLKGKPSFMKNTHFGVLRIKDAIVDYFNETTGERPSISKDMPDIQITVYISDNAVIVYLDSSGVPLFKRGYRTEHAGAPIKEDLAAGILLLSGYDGSQDLLDPMCGSGTFLFEGYMIATNKAPNVDRGFAFMHWNDYDKTSFLEIRQKLLAAEKQIETKILGFDRDGHASYIANKIKKDFFQNNNNKIRIMTGDFRKIEESFENFIVVTNPPYGERVKVDEDIIYFYKDIGDFFKKQCQNSSAWVFTANLEAAKFIGLRSSKRIPLFNGPLEARLIEYKTF